MTDKKQAQPKDLDLAGHYPLSDGRAHFFHAYDVPELLEMVAAFMRANNLEDLLTISVQPLAASLVNAKGWRYTATIAYEASVPAQRSAVLKREVRHEHKSTGKQHRARRSHTGY